MTLSTKCENFDINRNSSTFGVVLVTIATGPASTAAAVSTPCRTCYVSLNTGSHDFYVDAITAATATGFKIAAAAAPFEIPINDVQKMNFIGTAGEIVQILWRS